MTFHDLLLAQFEPYFNISINIDEVSMSPIIIFTSKKSQLINMEEYVFTLPMIDMQDYTTSQGNKTTKRIDNMVSILKEIIRDNKLDELGL